MVKVRKPNRGRRATPVTLPAPTGGLNGRDALAEMSPTDAFLMENWFPANTSVDTRGGCLDYATGIGAAVESIEVFTGAGGSKMLAFAGGKIFDTTAGGVVGAALATGRTSNKTTSCMFSNAGAQFLLVYSGADAPFSYDGTTITNLVITGLTGSQNTLQEAMAFKGRLFLRQADQLGFYFLPPGDIQGAASYFDLQQQSLKGGALAAICTFSQDIAGNSPQDFAVFVSTEGEYIMYQGTDPSDADNWALAGRFFGPPPIGKKSWFRFRSDAYFLTEEGVLSLTEIRENGETTDNTEYLTSKLGRGFTDLLTFESTHGWAGLIYPKGSSLIVNVPLSGTITGQYVQFIMNTNTNAWTMYTGWNAISWALCNQLAYFGTSDGKVVLSDTGNMDNGTQILAQARQAWNSFDIGNGVSSYAPSGGIGYDDKQFHFITFALQADGVPAISCSLNVNFEDDQPEITTPLAPGSGGVWGSATWDVDAWGGASSSQSLTVSIGKIGYVASPWLQAVSLASKVRWFASRISLEKTKEVLL